MIHSPARAALALTTAALLAACASEPREPAPVVFRGSDPANSRAANTEANRTPDSRGVIQRDGFETIRARRGDTVDSMAARVGISGAELAAYNGLSTQYQPKEGDDLVLPSRSGSSLGESAVAANTPTAPAVTAPAVTAPEALPPATSTDGGWSAELAREAIAAPVEPTGANASGGNGLAPAPRPAAPANTVPSDAPTPAAVETASVATAPASTPPVAAGGRFLRPVAAPVSRKFSRAPGADRNDGVDFATRAGDPVHAAGDGEVALISQSLGGLGTIVLIRHDDQLLTVYGRIDEVTVKKGDKVARGQRIARVANLADRSPEMHFEVREGADSVDPEKYF